MDKVRFTAVVTFVLILGGCSQQHALRSPSDNSENYYALPSQGNNIPVQEDTQSRCTPQSNIVADGSYHVDRALEPDALVQGVKMPSKYLNMGMPLSVGDMVDLNIEDGDGYSGRYIINPDGAIQLPYLSPIQIVGLSAEEAEQLIELTLVRAQVFRPLTAKVSVRVLHWAPVEVFVSGAVFDSGRVRINERNSESVIADKVSAFGDHAPRRFLSEALRAASGIRPDAKLDQVIVIRNGWQVELDLTGILTGDLSRDIALAQGDRVVVPTTGCFQPGLVRPSQITPKGFRVFMSNLTNPSFDNASAAVGRYSANLPYGTRLLQASVSANCVGGTQLTNAPRKVVLVTRNPLSGETQVLERSVEQLMRFANRDDVNPYVMPNDALACYDSDVTNLRDVARGLGEILSPWKLLL